MNNKPFTPKDPAKYALAHSLYNERVPMAQIASRTGVRLTSLYRWCKLGAWDTTRTAIAISPKTIYNRLLEKLNDIVENEDPLLHADAIAKVAKQLRSLVADTTTDQVIAVLSGFGDWLIANANTMQATKETIQEITRLQDAYITYHININRTEPL